MFKHINQTTISIIILIFVIASCQKKQRNLSFYEDEQVDGDALVVDEYHTASSSSSVEVPFVDNNGVKCIDVVINGTIGVNMIIDSGCSGALISVDEANYLYRKGVLNENDIIGVSSSQIADGSIVENMVVNLRQVVIGNSIICRDVTATVSASSNAPLLLGNEVLNRTASYTIDNEKKVIKFNLR